MTDLLNALLKIFFRIFLFLLGFFIAAVLLMTMLAVFLAWMVAALWARITGRAVRPMMRINPLDGWRRPPFSNRSAARNARTDNHRPAPGDEIIDIEAREVPPDERR